MKHFCFSPSVAAALMVASLAASPACADITFDFDSPAQLSSGLLDGDLRNFAITSEQFRSGSGSLKFVDPAPEPYESFTYDVPFDTFTSGIISAHFYDTRGSFNLGHGAAKSGGAIILEDKDNPQDFVALEVLTFPYGVGGTSIPGYYGTEGSVDRLKPSDRFDYANFPARSVGFHKVEFHVSATDTRIYVDGKMSLEVAGPGSASNLRLRFMADSPSNGSTGNWVTAPKTSSVYIGEWLYFDDIKFSRELPTAAQHSNGFEIVGGTPEYDSAGVTGSPGSPGVPPNDNAYMNKFVNQWSVSTSATAAHTGTQSAYFANATPILKSMTFDLTGVQANTSATLYFYDALGQNADFDHDNSVIIENANDPGEFLAAEISNWPYPYSSPTKNYYATEGQGGGGSFWSGTFPGRSIGWHKIEIGFYPTHTLIALDNAVAHRNNPAILAMGPGVDKPLRLRLMADGATQGGYGNWTTVNELTALYHVSTEPYVYYDDITLPIPAAAGVSEWQLY